MDEWASGRIGKRTNGRMDCAATVMLHFRHRKVGAVRTLLCAGPTGNCRCRGSGLALRFLWRLGSLRLTPSAAIGPYCICCRSESMLDPSLHHSHRYLANRTSEKYVKIAHISDPSLHHSHHYLASRASKKNVKMPVICATNIREAEWVQWSVA